MLEAIFVDRAEELIGLDLFVNDVKSGKTKIVFLCGESGVGKRSLAEEFIKKHKDLSVFSHNCTSAEKKTPFVVLTSLMGRKMTSSVPAAFKPRIKSVLENFKGKKRSLEDMDTDALYSEIALLLSDISKHKPILLFINNYQWADRSSVAFIGHIAAQAKRGGIMIIGSFSPEMEGDDFISESIALLTLEGHANVMTLERFDEPTTKTFLEKLLNAKMPPKFNHRIYSETKGNPLFTRALIETLVQEGLIDPTDKNFEKKVEKLKLTLPKSVMELTMKRIRMLDDDSQKILKVASVLGSQFRFDVLARIVDVDRTELHGKLSNLIENKLIYQDMDAKDESYDFDHVKVRETIYKQMGKSERLALHRYAGNAYEALFKDKSEFAYPMSHHFSMCGLNDKAFRYARFAGEMALKRNAPEDAVRDFEDSLKLLKKIKIKNKLKLAHEIQVKLGDANFIIGRWDDAHKSYLAALKSSRSSKNKRLMSMSNRKLGELMRFRGEYSTARAYFEEALALSKQVDDSRGIADSYKGLAYLYWRQGNFPKALDFYDRCIISAKKLKDDVLLGVALLEKGNVHNTMGDLDEAMKHYRECLTHLEKIQNISQIARVYNNMGDISLQREDWAEAMKFFERSRSAAEQVGGRYMVAWSLFNEAEALARLSRPEDALKNCEESLEILTSLGDKMGILAVHRNFGIAFGVKEDWDRAEENFVKSLEMAKELNIPDAMAEVYLHRAKVLNAKGERENAKKNLTEALNIVRQINAKRWIARIEKELQMLG
jgi:tetratricopeptide (TPR) repeat protein